jgi:cysteinyl-tRNA synthetase
VVRFFILQSHYRSTLDFSEAAVSGAGKGLEKLHTTLRHIQERLATATPEGEPTGIDLQAHAQKFCSAMDEDFNAPQAIAVLFDLSREVNTVLQSGTKIKAEDLRAIEAFFHTHAGNVLGMALGGKEAAVQDQGFERGLMSPYRAAGRHAERKTLEPVRQVRWIDTLDHAQHNMKDDVKRTPQA